MKWLSEMTTEVLSNINGLLFDLDGTFVTKGRLKASTYQSLESLRLADIKTIAVTGRPAGWCDLIARWWPVDSVVGENGAFSYSRKNNKIYRKTFHPPVSHMKEQSKLNLLFQELLTKYNFLSLASDQSFRHWDLAIDISEEHEVSMNVSMDIVKFCEDRGANAAISDIHVNVWFGDYNKETMSLDVLNNFDIDKKETIFIGDSPNDSPMFRCFPFSVGVSSVRKYADMMDYLPTYVTEEDSGEGFTELANLILSTK